MIRRMKETDLEDVMELYAGARAFMKRIGNGTQWKDSWPPREVIEEDLEKQRIHVLEEDGTILAVFMYVYGDHAEHDYDVMVSGEWLLDGPYGVVHRIAAREGSHAGRECLRWAIRESDGHLRIDTHKNNAAMIHTLRTLGFTECGIIRLSNGEDRIAFEIISA